MSSVEFESKNQAKPEIIRRVEDQRKRDNLRSEQETAALGRIPKIKELLGSILNDQEDELQRYPLIIINDQFYLPMEEGNEVTVEVRTDAYNATIRVPEVNETLFLVGSSPRIDKGEKYQSITDFPRANVEDMDRFIELLQYISDGNAKYHRMVEHRIPARR